MEVVTFAKANGSYTNMNSTCDQMTLYRNILQLNFNLILECDWSWQVHQHRK